MNVERTGWRDQSISERHRTWGAGCTAVDLDLVLVEYHLARPVAIVEYKHHRGSVDFGSPNYRALRDLANRADLPFLITFYWPEVWAFRVQPMNDAALRHFAPGGEMLTEREFVERLYRMRAVFVQDALLPGLRSVLPHGAADGDETHELVAMPVRR